MGAFLSRLLDFIQNANSVTYISSALENFHRLTQGDYNGTDPLNYRYFTEGKFTMESLSNNNDVLMDMSVSGNNVVNNTTFTKNIVMNTKMNNKIISYGMMINDDGQLEMFKHDNSLNKSTTVMTFGQSDITSQSISNDENITIGYSNIISKSEFPELFLQNIY
jgi:hypothetical protein